MNLRSPAGDDSLPSGSVCGVANNAGGAGLRAVCPTASRSCWITLLLKVPESSPKDMALAIYIHLNWISCLSVM